MCDPRYNDVNVILMAKPPEAGEAKTRLALDVGDKVAIDVYTRLLNDRLNALQSCKAFRKTVYTYGPERYLADLTVRGLLLDSDIGDYAFQEKVYWAFHNSFAHCPHTIMIVADDPSISARFLDYVIPKVLSGHVLVGPTRDGGLYLIGISEPHLPIVKGLPFGRAHLCDTLIRRAILRTSRCEVLSQHIDVDTEDDLAAHGLTL